MHDLKKHREVLKLACALTTCPELFIEQVCERLSACFSQIEVFGGVDNRLLQCYQFLESLCKVLPQLQSNDVCLKTVACFAKNVTFVFVPQRFNEYFVGLLQTSILRDENRCWKYPPMCYCIK